MYVIRRSIYEIDHSRTTKLSAYTAVCVKRILNVNFARVQGIVRATGPYGRNVVDSLTTGFGHRDSSRHGWCR